MRLRSLRSPKTGITWKLDDDMTRRLNEEFMRQSDIVHNGYAAVGFYFSSLEVLFDALFAVGPQEVSFREFRNRSWAERFKLVLPPSSDRDLAKLYGELRLIKSDVRDVLFHGSGDDESLLVGALPRLGMIPVSYEGTSDSVLFNMMAVLDADLLAKAMQTLWPNVFRFGLRALAAAMAIVAPESARSMPASETAAGHEAESACEPSPVRGRPPAAPAGRSLSGI